MNDEKHLRRLEKVRSGKFLWPWERRRVQLEMWYRIQEELEHICSAQHTEAHLVEDGS